uniref:NADH-ubiquinone oxidoreductase chain 4 n=1 Tax=Dianemobius fascipes TaxID=1581339 RepID=A0A6B9VYC0_9ORTH|nr:NADH dehydrogenase subunit 4 [Dianemobius fascipes]QHQ73090.1 NADH dehydrogenase subunit 4 [Dianemobius fascipes]
MIKFLMFIIFMIPFSGLYFVNWYMVQIMLMLLMFIFMLKIVLGLEIEYVGMGMGIDLMSYGLIMLSVWISLLMVLASVSVSKFGLNEKFFLFLILILLLFLVLSFSMLSMIGFYLFFEASLIPTLILIIGWGYQPERIQAGIYLLFYTLLASLPMLIGVLKILSDKGTLEFNLMEGCEVKNLLMYMSLIGAFLVKMPMFLVHLWLPSAHVEAPLAGSMILAGVLLKLGGYGLLRMFKLMVEVGVKFNFLWISISLIGGCLVSCICLRQVDMKSLIAYSSVSHMGILLGGLMTLNGWGMMSAYTMMISHGLCSSGLFCLSNTCYERTGSRSMMINKGMLTLMPSMSLWWFLLCSSNMAAPPSLNLMAEMGLFMSLISWNSFNGIWLGVMSFLSAGYSLYLYSYSQHGKFYSGVYSFSGGKLAEYALMLFHWLPLNILVMFSEYFCLWT